MNTPKSQSGSTVVLGFDNTFAAQLEGLYVPVTPKGFPAPRLVYLNRPLLTELGLDETLIERHAENLFSGVLVPSDAAPLAQAYAGHQFGGFSPQLGDGRALLLGELVDRNGTRRDVQLKGSGPTPFSRGGDGRATLSSVLREVIMGEALHALGIPTTRALAAVTTGEVVRRAHPQEGAVLTRIASSHLRVGTLEFFAARQDDEKLQALVDYAWARHTPDRTRHGNHALDLLEGVAVLQAELIAQWLHVGFVHGVMNTDNCALSGETIDFGPCAFMDATDPATVFSSIDHAGRYAYGNQSRIGKWNLARMAESLLGLIAPSPEQAVPLAEAALQLYDDTFEAAWLSGMRDKLGLQGEHDADKDLADDLITWMTDEGRDWTHTFRLLGDMLATGSNPLGEGFVGAGPWITRWRKRLEGQDLQGTATRMHAVNPVYIARNHLVEDALDAGVSGNLTRMHTLLEVLARPFEVQPGRETYAEPAPDSFTASYQTFCGT